MTLNAWWACGACDTILTALYAKFHYNLRVCPNWTYGKTLSFQGVKLVITFFTIRGVEAGVTSSSTGSALITIGWWIFGKVTQTTRLNTLVSILWQYKTLHTTCTFAITSTDCTWRQAPFANQLTDAKIMRQRTLKNTFILKFKIWV